MKTITQNEFTALVSSAYAVVVNYDPFMQYVGYDDQDRLYIAEYDNEDITYLDNLEGDIEVHHDSMHATVNGERLTLQLLEIKKLS
jgi:hypothetical protein